MDGLSVTNFVVEAATEVLFSVLEALAVETAGDGFSVAALEVCMVNPNAVVEHNRGDR